MFRVKRLTFVVLIAFLVGTIGIPSPVSTVNLTAFYGAEPAVAQQAKKKRKRRGLFSILFGRKKAKKKAVTKKSKTRTKRGKKTRTAKRSANKAVASVKAVEKAADAKVILVVGDFFAAGLADGLTASLAEVANLKVVDKSKGLSGFVRSDIIDWPSVLPQLVEEHKPAYVVAMLGSNDRQQIREGRKRIKRTSPEWLTAYTQRVNGLGEALKATGVNYAWVGLPPVRFRKMNKDFLQFNEIYGKAATSSRGQFIDIWDGFSDADGNYSRSGPDVNGQIVLLRWKDGINLTRAGKSRLSYYVEGRIQKLFSGEIGADAALANANIDYESYAARSPLYDPAVTGKTYVVRLDDPAADGSDALAGEVVEVSPGLRPSEIVPNVGETSLAGEHAGRVDNYAWPPQDDINPAPIAIAAPAANGTQTDLRTTLTGVVEQGSTPVQN